MHSQRPPHPVFSFFKSGKSEPALGTAPAVADAAPEAPRLSWAQRLKQGLSRTRGALGGQIAGLFGVGAKIDEALFEELETVLLSADVGVEATQHLTDRLRTRVADVCLDYGLERIQFSAFFGKLNRNRRQELALRVQNELGGENGRVRIIPVCEQDLKDMWVLDQYRRDADELKAEADQEKPRLRVLTAED